MGRIGILPKAFTRIHPGHRSPVFAVAVQFAIAVIATLALGFAWDPVTAFVLVATIIVIVVVAVYIIVNAACIGFFLRHERASFSPVRHLVIPVLGIIAFVPALLTAAGIPAFSFVTKLTTPVSYAGPIVGVWMLIGIVYLAVLWSRDRRRVVALGVVHLDSEPDVEFAGATEEVSR
jgi:amino acid transporter